VIEKQDRRRDVGRGIGAAQRHFDLRFFRVTPNGCHVPNSSATARAFRAPL
jgi:hypothetical protein